MFFRVFFVYKPYLGATKTDKTMKISDYCASERPREKLLSRGPAALGNAELLAEGIVLTDAPAGTQWSRKES